MAPVTAVLVLLLGCAPSARSGGPVTDASEEQGAGCLFCSDATDDESLALQVKAELDRTCAGVESCHESGAGDMLLSSGHDFSALIDVTSSENPPMKRVLPGNPAQSYVLIKLACEGGIPDGGCMPLGLPTDPRLVRLFHDWIEGGAPTQ